MYDNIVFRTKPHIGINYLTMAYCAPLGQTPLEEAAHSRLNLVPSIVNVTATVDDSSFLSRRTHLYGFDLEYP